MGFKKFHRLSFQRDNFLHHLITGGDHGGRCLEGALSDNQWKIRRSTLELSRALERITPVLPVPRIDPSGSVGEGSIRLP